MLTAHISKESDRKIPRAREIALNGNQPWGVLARHLLRWNSNVIANVVKIKEILSPRFVPKVFLLIKMSSPFMQCQAEFGKYSQLPISGRFLNKEKLLPDRQVLKQSLIVNFQYSACSV